MTPEALNAEVERRQRAIMDQGTLQAGAPEGDELHASRWRYIPLHRLLTAEGNLLHKRPNGRLETGHEPLHGSKSGRCLLLNPATGRWHCRSCGRGGDAAAWVMDYRGYSYRHAAKWLLARFGPPPQTTRATEARHAR
jgi:hypothetical protein